MQKCSDAIYATVSRHLKILLVHDQYHLYKHPQYNYQHQIHDSDHGERSRVEIITS